MQGAGVITIMLVWLERNRLLVLAVASAAFGLMIVASAFATSGRPALVLRPDASLPGDGAALVVHVSGAVVRPGVYDLTAGQRVVDALDAAGGAVANADTDALNLARRLRDGERIVVPTRSGSTQPAATVPTLAPGEKLDINTVTREQLDLLPGIGEAYSRRIVDSRAVDGPFASVDDLLARNVLPRAVFERIRDLISAGR